MGIPSTLYLCQVFLNLPLKISKQTYKKLFFCKGIILKILLYDYFLYTNVI